MCDTLRSLRAGPAVILASVRAMFFVYLVFLTSVTAYFIVIGLTHS
jgi:hypothetical protein